MLSGAGTAPRSHEAWEGEAPAEPRVGAGDELRGRLGGSLALPALALPQASWGREPRPPGAASDAVFLRQIGGILAKFVAHT